MGYATPVLVYNDAVDAIERDTTLGPRLARAIRGQAVPSFVWDSINRGLDVGSFAPGLLIGEPVHSSQRRLIMVGENWQLPFTQRSFTRLAARDQLGLLEQAIKDAERELESMKAMLGAASDAQAD